MNLETIKENRTPESETLTNNSVFPGAVADISDQLTNESISDVSESNAESPSPSDEIDDEDSAMAPSAMAPSAIAPLDTNPSATAPLDTNPSAIAPSAIASSETAPSAIAPSAMAPPMNTIAENPPFLKSGPPKVFGEQPSIPTNLKKAINFRKTLKHKKRSEYERLSDGDKLIAKKQIVNNLINVLRSSTQKTTFQHHKKSIVKLRHTLNKHLDYIETKKSTKSNKKPERKIFKKSRRSKQI